MDENKQDLLKKLVKPFGTSCQFESGGNEAFCLSERKRIQRERAEMEGEGCFAALVWRRGLYSSKGKSSNEGRKFYVVCLPSLAIRWCYLQCL